MQLDSASLFKWNCRKQNISNWHERRRPILQGVFSTTVCRATPEVQSATPLSLAHRVPTSHVGEADGLYNALGPILLCLIRFWFVIPKRGVVMMCCVLETWTETAEKMRQFNLEFQPGIHRNWKGIWWSIYFFICAMLMLRQQTVIKLCYRVY